MVRTCLIKGLIILCFSLRSVSLRRRQSCRMFAMKSFCWRWLQSSGHHKESLQHLQPWALPPPVVQGGNCHVLVPPIRKFKLHQSRVPPRQVNVALSKKAVFVILCHSLITRKSLVLSTYTYSQLIFSKFLNRTLHILKCHFHVSPLCYTYFLK